MNFMEHLAAGEDVDIDDFIDQWHDAKGSQTESLHEFLGMTLDEYAGWLERRLTEEQILEMRKAAEIPGHETE